MVLRVGSIDDLPAEIRKRNGFGTMRDVKKPAFASFADQTGAKAPNARGTHKPGVMNKTERAYAEHLRMRQERGEVIQFWFESWRFRLADRTYYNPDFVVMLANGELEAHEVKGHWEDDARVKIKVADEHFPLRFIAVQRHEGSWKFETIGRER